MSKYGPHAHVFAENRGVAVWKTDYLTLRMEEHEVGVLFGRFSDVDSDG